MSDYSIIRQQATDLAESRYWKDAQDKAQAIAKVAAGAELGIPPVMSMSQVQIIQGKPTLGAGAIAGLVKGSGKYTYRVVRHTDTECVLAFHEKALDGRSWEDLGEVAFTMEDARKANLLRNPTWKAYPKNMLFARAISNGARWHCPDIFHGSIYSTEEMQDVERMGGADVIDVEVEQAEVVSPPTAVKQIAGRPQWSSATEAHQWAVEAGHYKTDEDAQVAYKHSCADLMHRGGQPTSDALYDAWYVWATNAKAWIKASAHLHAKAKELGQDGERARGWIRKAYAKAAGREVESTREIPLAEYRDLVTRCIAKMGKAS